MGKLWNENIKLVVYVCVRQNQDFVFIILILKNKNIFVDKNAELDYIKYIIYFSY